MRALLALGLAALLAHDTYVARASLGAVALALSIAVVSALCVYAVASADEAR